MTPILYGLTSAKHNTRNVNGYRLHSSTKNLTSVFAVWQTIRGTMRTELYRASGSRGWVVVQIVVTDGQTTQDHTIHGC